MKEVIEIIMAIKDIAIIVGGCLLAILYVFLVIRAIIKKKQSGKSVNVVQTMAEIAQQVMPLVGAAEVAFKSVSDKKTGTLKLKDVLNDIKDMCAEKGITYDKSYWTDYVKEAVNLININRDLPQLIAGEVANATEDKTEQQATPVASYTTTTNI